MTLRTISVLFATLAITAAPVMAFSDSLAQELSILSDRFHLTFPAEARNEARSVDIMSAPPGEEEETRIVLDQGEERMVFFARELGILGTHDLADDWVRELGRSGLACKAEPLAGNRAVVVYGPEQVTMGSEAIFLSGLLVQCADGLLVNLQVYMNPKARERLADQQALVDRIFATYRSGTRVMDLSPRTVTLSRMELDLPKDHYVTKDAAYDFEVYRIHRPRPLGSDVRTSITIYVGHHPSPFSRNLGKDVVTSQVPGELFGKQIDWTRASDAELGILLMERILELEDGSKIHIAVTASDEKALEETMKLVGRMRPRP